MRPECRMAKYFMVASVFFISTSLFASGYTLLNDKQYAATVSDARAKISDHLHELDVKRHESMNSQINTIVEQLSNIPYLYVGAMGEGDWQASSPVYQSGAVHISQDPVYRLDGLNCQTLVQMVMGLLYSNNLNQFDRNMIKIAYGATNHSDDDQIHFYNRNHFVEADFNPVNQRHGFLQDVTSQGELSQYAKTTQAVISRSQWLAIQQIQPKKYVRVLHAKDGESMAKRFISGFNRYTTLFQQDNVVSISYLPKTSLVIRSSDGDYEPNETLLNMIPTPAVAEIVCDAKKWTINGSLIRDVIGTEMSVSHFGILSRKTFKRGEIIYHRINCQHRFDHDIACQVEPVICDKVSCKELMFTHATDGYPSRHYWYQLSDGKYVCSSKKPANHASYTTCNRVESLPLFNYLTNYQFGSYWYMNTPSILGVHIEKLATNQPKS